MLGVITMTMMADGVSPAGAVVSSHTATYAPVGPATAAQLKADARILTLRLDRLGASFVHVAVANGDIVLSSARRAISVSLLNEVDQTAQLYFRPVLCYAYPEHVPQGDTSQTLPRGVESVPTCAPASQLTAADLRVTPNASPQGYSIETVPPDSQYVDEPSTSVDKPGYATSIVLLPGLSPADNGERYVLGPAQMSGRSISSAKAVRDQTGAWVVDYNLAGSAGSELWGHVAEENFHQILGIELDGVVYSAPLIQPTQSSFSSFDGKGEISGDLTKGEAQQLALVMNSGTIPVPLRLLTVQS